MHAARSADGVVPAEWALEDLRHAQPSAAAAVEPDDLPDAPEDDGAWVGEAELEQLRAELAAEMEDAFRAELEARVSEAYEQGYEQGRQEGEQAEGTRLRNVVQLTEGALDEIREGEVRWTGAIEENICALAVAVARQVIGRELQGDETTVVDLVRRALAEFPIDQPVRVRVHPQDLATLQSAGASGGALQTRPEREARWIADARIAPGGCVVEGRDRIVDGRIDTGLERIYRRLTYSHV